MELLFNNLPKRFSVDSLFESLDAKKEMNKLKNNIDLCIMDQKIERYI